MSYWTNDELKRNRAAQDAALAERHRGFDLAAKDKTPKSARHHWAVVGEGSQSANLNYARGYAAIDWNR